MSASNRIELESSSDRLVREYPLLCESVSSSLSISSLHIVSIWEHSNTEEDHDDRYYDDHLDESES